MRPINLVTLIDDDEMVSFIEKITIEQTQLVNQVKVFSNGQLAIDFLKANSGQSHLLPEIILLDLNMPVMDGFQFLEAFIKLEPKLGKKITIFIVSSSISQQDFDRINKISEVSDYLIKPLSREKFKAIVAAMLAKSKVK